MQKERHDSSLEIADILPISVLSAAQFEMIGSPEVNQTRHHDRLMIWACLCSAILFQENVRVDDFTHDEHEITTQLVALASRCHNCH